MSSAQIDSPVQLAQRGVYLGILINILLAAIKATAGILGNSYALVADAIESCSDVFTSLVVLIGLKMAGKPADSSHPYGHGKFEPLATLAVGLSLFAAAIIISVESIKEILTPHHAPESFTLIVLVLVIFTKEILFRFIKSLGHRSESSAVEADAWHHRSDALTSLAAFIGIAIAILGGPGYESADDYAALLSALIISINAGLILKSALFELSDAAPSPEIALKIRQTAESIDGVLGTHKCHVRKLGFDYFVDLDILCNPDSSIREGHEIAHQVGKALKIAIPKISKVLVHVEPVDDYGWR